MLSDRRKQLVYLAAGLAACIVLVLAFADDSDYRALLAARAQKLSDDVKFDPGDIAKAIISSSYADWKSEESSHNLSYPQIIMKLC